MSRQARLFGEYLHVIVRGIGKQVLFEDDADRRFFIYLLQKYKGDCNIVILAYCLMDNHVHLLIRDTQKNTPLFMKKLGVSYANHYNVKYERVGHLFQDRYRSEIITDDRALMSVYRYILNNPAKAGICRAQDYKWSSIHEYGCRGITDNSILFDLIGDRKALLVFLSLSDEIVFLDDVTAKHDDSRAKDIIKRELHSSSGTVLQQMSKRERDRMIIKLRAEGLTVRQLERLTGITRGVIQKSKVDK